MKFTRIAILLLSLSLCRTVFAQSTVYERNANNQEENSTMNRSSGCSDFFSYSTGDVIYNICDETGYTLIFEDNFDGDSLDKNKWQLRPWGAGSFDGAQEYNKLSNAVVSNGTLKIVAKREYTWARAIDYLPDDYILPDGHINLRNFFYTSSNLWTKDSFLYGIFEAKIKIVKRKGCLSSFWMFADNPWNEIDIFEFWNIPGNGEYNPERSASTINTNVHYDYDEDGATNSCSKSYRGTDYSEDFHIYKVIWARNKISWYVDNELIREYHSNYEYLIDFPNPVECELYPLKAYIRRLVYPRKPMNLILSLAIANGINAPDLQTVFPVEMEIDWVRCYQHIADEDVVIEDMSNFHFDDYYANIITGNNVTFNCDFTIDSLMSLNILARNEIILKPGFEAKKGSMVNVSIVGEPENRLYSELCDSVYYELRQKKKTDELVLCQDIQISPNPVSKTFLVNSNIIDLYHSRVIVFDMKGNKVIEKYSEDANGICMDVSNLPTGIYFVKIISIKDELLSIKKIVKK
ncbi:MAG: family 16 glycosylhydrolase [Bacteroidales bacterium]|nr:family 16 glycosylhydrolase [Bacteroidales bacterium]